MNLHYRFMSHSLAVLLLACADPVNSGITGSTAGVVLEPAVQSSTPLPGYLHRDRSKMALGEFVVSDYAYEFERIVGTDGILAFGRHGVTIGSLNSDARPEYRAPFTGLPEEHSKQIVDYFVGAGLPSNQIGDVRMTAAMEASGSVLSRWQGEQLKPKLLYYTTELSRRTDGIAIHGSYAMASLNASSAVMSEEVFWPPIPAEVITAASALAGRLTSEAAQRTLKNRIGDAVFGLVPTAVVVHSPHFQEAFQVYAAVFFFGAKTATHYGEDGTPIRFNFEQVNADGDRRP